MSELPDISEEHARRVLARPKPRKIVLHDLDDVIAEFGIDLDD